MNSPILITGIPRGGTNIIAAVIHRCGAFGGIMTKQNRDYEEGEYNNDHIRDKIVKNYFERNGWDIKGQYPLPTTEEVVIPPLWGEKIEAILINEGYRGGPWMYKDAKLSLIWPVWHDAFPGAKWVIVRRRTGDVIQSCLKTGYMTAYEDKEGWLEWVHAYENKYVEMVDAGIDCKIIWPERLVDGDFRQLQELVEWLGLKWRDEIKEYVEPLLWKGNKKGVLNGK